MPRHRKSFSLGSRDAREPEAIADRLPLLVDGNKQPIKASAEPSLGLLRQLKPVDSADFDEFVRQGYFGWRHAWSTMKGNDWVEPFVPLARTLVVDRTRPVSAAP